LELDWFGARLVWELYSWPTAKPLTLSLSVPSTTPLKTILGHIWDALGVSGTECQTGWFDTPCLEVPLDAFRVPLGGYTLTPLPPDVSFGASE
jgi:hypothetical protein